MSVVSKSSWWGFLARIVLGGTLLFAGYLKIGSPYKSAAAVRAYELLPISLANFIGYVLPWVEVGLGLALMAGLAIRWSSLISALLMVAFIGGVSSAWARGLTIDCGCFGGGGKVAANQTAYGTEILRDLGLLVLALYLVWRPRSKFSLANLGSGNGRIGTADQRSEDGE